MFSWNHGMGQPQLLSLKQDHGPLQTQQQRMELGDPAGFILDPPSRRNPRNVMVRERPGRPAVCFTGLGRRGGDVPTVQFRRK